MKTAISLLCSFAVVLATCSVFAETTVERKSDRAVVKIDGKPFTEYLVKSGAKPILWPILGPAEKPMTRPYPMIDYVAKSKEDEKKFKDHPHHRSLWFMHGDVNGVDFWLEGKGKGTVVHREFVETKSGDVGLIVTRNDWIAPDGKKVCEDERKITLGGDAKKRWIDYQITLKASEGPVHFGDTKEGTFALRVPDSMRGDIKNGGKITNSDGLVNDAAWGLPAAWVDYFGPVDGANQGIAILQHPTTFHYPEPWHVRTYGLFAANPFGLKDFAKEKMKKGSKEKLLDGSYTLPKGESIVFRMKFIFHDGDDKQADIVGEFEKYKKE